MDKLEETKNTEVFWLYNTFNNVRSRHLFFYISKFTDSSLRFNWIDWIEVSYWSIGPETDETTVRNIEEVHILEERSWSSQEGQKIRFLRG